MKRKTLKIVSFIVAMTLIGLLIFITNSFVGNPISAMIAEKNIKQHIDKNYSHLDLTYTKPIYNFKFGEYVSKVKDKTSADTHFDVQYRDGKICDSYQSDVVERWNTYMRLSDEYASIVEPIIKKSMPYEFSMVIVYLIKDDYSAEKLTMDMDFDLYNLPLKGEVTIYPYTNDLSWENVAKITLELDSLMQKSNLDIVNYSVSLEEKNKDNDKKYESIGVHNFPKEFLTKDNLPQFMNEFTNKANSEKNNVK